VDRLFFYILIEESLHCWHQNFLKVNLWSIIFFLTWATIGLSFSSDALFYDKGGIEHATRRYFPQLPNIREKSYHY